MSKSLLLFQRVIFTLFILAACLCYTSAVSARTCFLPDSEDCGNGEGEVPDADVTCASYGGYDTEAACKTDYADVAVICSLNNGCYYPYCQYRNERSCLKDMTSSEKCLSKKVEALDETCWYKEGKTCRELNSDYIGGNMPCRADFSGQKVVKEEVPGVTGSDGQCYTCDVFKTCKQLNADYYNVNEPCPENTERKDSGKVGSDGQCYTCENKRCSDSGWKVSGSCGINEKETEVGSGIEGTCVECTLKTCREINGSWMPKAECSGIASVTGTTGADGECYTCTIESCPTGYSADVTSCGADYKLDKNGTANGKDCGKCIRKETCADYSLINEAACDTSKNTFTFNRSDDYGNKCGTCSENPEVGNGTITIAGINIVCDYNLASKCDTADFVFTSGTTKVDIINSSGETVKTFTVDNVTGAASSQSVSLPAGEYKVEYGIYDEDQLCIQDENNKYAYYNRICDSTCTNGSCHYTLLMDYQGGTSLSVKAGETKEISLDYTFNNRMFFRCKADSSSRIAGCQLYTYGMDENGVTSYAAAQGYPQTIAGDGGTLYISVGSSYICGGVTDHFNTSTSPRVPTLGSPDLEECWEHYKWGHCDFYMGPGPNVKVYNPNSYGAGTLLYSDYFTFEIDKVDCR
ncbi:MAG: hypothetical protein Q4D80_00005 [Pseudomonadota bacterium]|nr:hypothetical protein [Pseudomonadota bacterium]